METELLITEIKHLLELEKTKKREKKARGECFNIFSIMEMKTDEVYTHSAIIKELLNPKGSHGQGDTYLKLFLQVIPELQSIEDFDTANAKVKKECSINKSDEQSGRIDILIQSGDKAIIIENKIYAEDQEKQLFRYKEFARSEYKSYNILYLTLRGKSASSQSLNGMRRTDYIRISYHDTIMDWLTSCINVSEGNPLVREVLIQYQNLIRELTFRESEEKYIQEICELCKSADDVIILKEKFKEQFVTIMSCKIHSFFLTKLAEIAQEKELYIEENGYDWSHEDKAFIFRKDDWETFEIVFLFKKENFSDLRCGFRYIDKNDNDIYTEKRDVYNELKKKSEEEATNRWPFIRKCKAYSDWKSENIIASIYDASLVEMIQDDLDNLLRIVEENHLSL